MSVLLQARVDAARPRVGLRDRCALGELPGHVVVDDVVDELDSREEVESIRKIVERGSGADRQLRVFKETGDLIKVVDYIIAETESSVDSAAGTGML